jgi:phosphohistidine phosphatase SixA
MCFEELKGDHSMRGIQLSLSLLFTFLAVMASSQPASSAEWINDLRHGGYVIVFRHGATTSDQKVDSMSNPAATKAPGERQLNNEGRAQAKSIGEAMHKLAIPVATVTTSPLQRAVDTGKLLGFGETTANPDLAEAGSAVSPEENTRRAQAMRALVATRPPAGSNLVLVSHKPNIMEAFGKDWSDLHEGEASVFEPDGKGAFKLIARVQADEWGKLTQAN